MPTVTMSEAVVYKGVTYGPGENINVPDDKNLIERINYFNEEFKARNEAAIAGGLALLPAGHPYNMMFPQVSNQPPESEVEAVSPSSAYFSVAQASPAVFTADGATVSGTGAAKEEPFQAGQQVPTAVDPADVIPKEISALAELKPPEPVDEESGETTAPAKPATTSGSTSSSSGGSGSSGSSSSGSSGSGSSTKGGSS